MQTDAGSEVSVIIVTYNSENFLGECLCALGKQSYSEFELVIVDNASQDSTIEQIAGMNYKLLQLPENIGFAGGVNAGIKYSSGRYIVLLNPDTVPASDWLENIVAAAKKCSAAGIFASKMIDHVSALVDSAGDGCTTTGRGYKRGENQAPSRFTQQEYVFGACGGAMLIRQEVIENIGLLDEDFFLVYEDTDLCFRAQLAGWKCLFVPEAVVRHKVRSSIGEMSDLAVYYSVRNTRFVWVKNMPFKLIMKYFYLHIIQEWGSFVYFCVNHGKWRAYFRANIDFFRMLPKMIRRRKEVMRLKNISDQELEKMLTSLFEPKFFREKLKKMFDKG